MAEHILEVKNIHSQIVAQELCHFNKLLLISA